VALVKHQLCVATGVDVEAEVDVVLDGLSLFFHTIVNGSDVLKNLWSTLAIMALAVV